MYRYIVYCMGIFVIVLKAIVLMYLIQTVIPMGNFIRRWTLILVAPILEPMQRLVRHSVMNHFSLDLSPYILLVLLGYLARVCDYLIS